MDGREQGTDGGGDRGADEWEHEADKEEHGADGRECGADDRELGANGGEHGADGKERGADDGECGVDNKECGADGGGRTRGWTRLSVILFFYCLYLVIILTSMDNFWPL